MRSITKILQLGFCWLMLGTPALADSSVDLIPKPRSLVWQNGQFEVNAQTRLTYNSAQAEEVARLFSTWLQPTTGYLLPLGEGQSTNTIAFVQTPGDAKDESYQLSVTQKQITLTANSRAGLFYAMQTLRQLMPAELESQQPINRAAWVVPAVQIKDAPRFAYRGMHLDVSRHFFDIAFVKRYIDWLALHKLNRFQWHLTDDQGWRIEIKAFPKLTQVGASRHHTVVGHTYDYQPLFDDKPVSGFYTQAQVRELVAYAAARHVEVIPEIDIPGHSTAIVAAYPELSCHGQPVEVTGQFGIFEQVLCPTEKSFDFLRQVYQEVAELFPASRIHIGGDEVLKEQWLASEQVARLMQEQGLESPEQVQSYFIKRVADIVTDLGKTPVGWDEILEGGAAKQANIMSWRGEEGGIEAARLGHNVIMSPYQWLYFDAYQSRSLDEPKAIHGLTRLKQVYDYDPLPQSLTTQEQARILGAQGALWTEYVKTPRHAEYMVLPRLAALAEVLWSPIDARDWSSFSHRLPALLKRYQSMGLNPSLSAYYPQIRVENSAENELKVTLDTDIAGLPIHFTLDGEPVTINAPRYQAPLLIQTPTTVRASSWVDSQRSLLGNLQLSLAPHKGVGKSYKFKHAPAEGSEKRLLDGVLAVDQFYDVNDFTVLYGVDLDVTVDLQTSAALSKVVLGVDAGMHRQLHPPRRVKVYVSETGQQWQEVAHLNEAQIQGPVLTLTFPVRQGRFVRVFAENRQDSHDPQIPLLPLYIDELQIW
ncbi:beta-N-acetylhexosaminidase [Bowmanella pacifica]|uniref:beta-N-acetylhexosaminidase n=1 Tax=Bowmanella pacifica TaxID=502051 RepID=A0A917YRI4_9ALTE|nr:family 20 glycosylhydrolase [Bowmanella pacifica]GGO64685.1 beta-N-acetylhexosaminidase [Bowmanella pacifica]